jgi:hypothetical protein
MNFLFPTLRDHVSKNTCDFHTKNCCICLLPSKNKYEAPQAKKKWEEWFYLWKGYCFPVKYAPGEKIVQHWSF